MKDYKIKVNNEAENIEIQNAFFALGYGWTNELVKEVSTSQMAIDEGYGSEYEITFIFADSDGRLYHSSNNDDGYKSFVDSENKELTLPQLRDLVVLHRNDIHDANWVTEGDDQIYQDSNGKSFIFREQGWDELQRHEMRQAMWEKIKPKPKHAEPEQGLISGADALIAIGKGERVQYSFDDDQYWQADIANLKITDFGSGHFQFRLKPRTIKLELEIPAPFEPKVGDKCYRLAPILACGYTEFYFDNDSEDQFGAWDSEEKVKAVVAALRGIKG